MNEADLGSCELHAARFYTCEILDEPFPSPRV